MASIFKRKRKVKLDNGKIVVRQSQKYYTRLTDTDGINTNGKKKVENWAVALRTGTDIEKVDCGQEGIKELTPKLIPFFDTYILLCM
ncbi:MAG: hypothetical protein JW787_13375 [Sedimentisphaerales bacterium]|nr:hypothetical protein [Sedimentisphaerales bacterium]